jgi:nickel superoxide dismutase
MRSTVQSTLKNVAQTLVPLGALLALTVTPAVYVAAHCEVPCGIYDDARRFAEMQEDQTTIAKAITEIGNMTAQLQGGPEPLTINQTSRWVATKEAHASNIQHTIAQYFMTQRIKADDPQYVKKLTTAHAVMVAAMKCKQSPDDSAAKALHDAIHAFQAAYGG